MGSQVASSPVQESYRPADCVMIRTEDLWKTYDMGEVAVHALCGVSFEIARGEYVAIMGPSGSGKSTLAKLLQGFYQPVDGAIRLDGTDLRHLSANELRHTFGVVPQETILFSGTIYDNLQMANPHATFDEIVRACRMAEIHDAIEKLSQGYQTEIGERGAGLSGGQKQRIAIARALLKQPKILLFDEATSSLDQNTAEHFALTINQLKGKVGMLFITHGMPKTLQVDEVVRIGNGNLSAVGTQLQSVRKGDAADMLNTNDLPDDLATPQLSRS